ncbi:alpha-amylase family glycosyl hydrolase [Holophaga foetida]|uniref:alpha-amylase family glycosyl hydrolase n=1 Tax=Holophaga foetida TaxID=35839 RepID=UPI0002473F21|nr:alpha-amylase family glycosyl hydrolase [Holophaga foetida]
MTLRNTSDIDWHELTDRAYTPSPAAWEDQVFYFLMVDRFSDGKEKHYLDLKGKVVEKGTTPLFQPRDEGTAERAAWTEAGRGWCGGTLKGLESKLGYLKRLGVTAIWVSPIFQQVAFQPTYHGYGVQDFLSIDPHFGTEADLRRLVDRAHAVGIYVILDIILNHSGNVFSYRPDRYWVPQGDSGYFDPRWDGQPYPVAGFHDAKGLPSLPFAPSEEAWPYGAIWPEELQNPETFSRKGRISNWDHDPEFREGDFCDLKDIHHGSGDVGAFEPSAAFLALVECCRYWIASADLDGFRIDTVKHMELGATRLFASMIREFTQTLGKEKFFLLGEITGGRERAFDTLEMTGLDAALGIDDIPDKLEYLVKGYRNPSDYFGLFRNSMLVNKDSHVWFRDRVVTLFDDHDQVRKGKGKARYCAGEQGRKSILSVMALNALTLGIPCVYYGSEQYFNGAAEAEADGNDVFLRECMFGGPFGSMQSRERHFFNEESPAYAELARILALRAEKLALRRGRQYLRPISGNGIDFGVPEMLGGELRSLVAWSRILDRQEILVAINTDCDQARTAWVTLDAGLQREHFELTCLYSTDATRIGQKVMVEPRNGRAVSLTLQASGVEVWE